MDHNEPQNLPCSLARRLGAMTYDGLIILSLWLLGTLILLPFNAGQAIESANPLYQAWLLFLGWLYLGWSWKVPGQTLGMRAWRVHLEADSGQISWLATGIRYSVAWVSLVAAGAGFLFAVFHPRNAAWHDLASRTRLVHRPPVSKS